MGFHDFLINFEPENTLDWSQEAIDTETVILDEEDWGQLKKKIQKNRDEAEVLVYLGGKNKLNRKAVEDPRIDILLHPENFRKDSGLNHVLARKAAENNVAIGLDFSKLYSSKRRDLVMADWRKNIELCNKYNTPYLITTNAAEKEDLRPPRDLAAIINVLGGDGIKAVRQNPGKILEKAEKRRENRHVRPGVEKVKE